MTEAGEYQSSSSLLKPVDQYAMAVAVVDDASLASLGLSKKCFVQARNNLNSGSYPGVHVARPKKISTHRIEQPGMTGWE